jgi:cellulose synthase/poly-beta-1,6-N-acetylglucosamine synthase-like glycosyltransferase
MTSAPEGAASSLQWLFVPATDWIVAALIVIFAVGAARSLATDILARRALAGIRRSKLDAGLMQKLGQATHCPPPLFIILVPARNERDVISNTILHLAQLNYPTNRYVVLVVTDAREQADESSPGTCEIATALADQINARRIVPLIHVIQVPDWYGGSFGSTAKTFAKSTKGRALNYGLQYVSADARLRSADMLGIIDADGRPELDVLCHAAAKRQSEGALLLQGPVFQISNFREVSLVGKAAGIELSIYHLSSLARQLTSGRETARFLAGTNYFIDLNLIIELSGWSETALVEDAELGLRAFLTKRVVPKWLPCPEIEQTPPDRCTYHMQRERWVLGHLQLLPPIRRSRLPWRGKLSLYAKVLGAIVKGPLDVGVSVVGWISLAGGWASTMPSSIGWVMLVLLGGSIFTWDYFGRGAAMLSPYGPTRAPTAWATLYERLCFILAMPWLMIVQARPRVSALWKFLKNGGYGEWIKTARTKEIPTARNLAILSLAESLQDASSHSGPPQTSGDERCFTQLPAASRRSSSLETRS